MLALVVAAKTFLVPSLWVTTVATPSNIPLELHPVARMITFFKTLFAYDASGIFLAIETSPRNFTGFKIFGANAHGHPLINLIKNDLVFFRVAHAIELDKAVAQEFSLALEYLLITL